MKNQMVIDLKPVPLQEESASMESMKDHVIYTAEIEVDKPYEQLVISFESHHIQWFTCNVYDEHQLRGPALHVMKQPLDTLSIGEIAAFNSPTSIPGTILPGTWTIEFEILTDAKEDMQLILTYDLHERGETSPDFIENHSDILINATPHQATEKWYKGDFHTHTNYSDGSMTREGNIESAKYQALDFFVATDHNVVTHYWPNQQELAIFPGTELTTPRGHANFLFVDQPVFNHCTLEDMYSEDGVNKIIETNQENGLFSINHPFLAPWAWELQETRLNTLTSLEICNDPTFADNTSATEKALSLWSVLLNDGYRITAIGGSDSHLLPEEKYPDAIQPSLIGDPATYVYAAELSTEGLKAGIQAGHVVVSRDGFIEYTISGEEALLPGDQVTIDACRLEVKLERNDVSKIQWMVDGMVEKTDEGQASHLDVDFTDDAYHWVRVDIYDEDDVFIGTTNPFYWNEKTTKLETWGDALNEWNKKSDPV